MEFSNTKHASTSKPVLIAGNINNEEIHLYKSTGKGIGHGISIVNTMHVKKEYQENL